MDDEGDNYADLERPPTPQKETITKHYNVFIYDEENPNCRDKRRNILLGMFRKNKNVF